MNRKIKKFISEVGISDEAVKDQPESVKYMEKIFLDRIRDRGYLPITDIITKKDFSIEKDILPLSYFICRAIYVGKKRAFDKNLEEKFKELYQKRVIKW